MKSSSLELFFKTERDNCNQMVASIRHQSPLVDIDDFNWFLSNCLDPLMVNFDGLSNQISFPVAHAGFKHGLELASLNWLKNDFKREVVLNTWSGFYNKTLELVQGAPSQVFSETSNLLSHLISFGSEKARKWLSLMSKISKELDSHEALKGAGVVCAWMTGLAHFRELALLQFDSLSPRTVRILFGLTDTHDLTFHLEKLRADRWAKISSSLPQSNPPAYSMEMRIGQCHLLGGEFPSPPEALVSGEQLFIKSGTLAWQLYADIFGATLIPYDRAELKEIAAKSNQGLEFSAYREVIGLNDLRETSSIAMLSDTVVLTSSETFSVIILSRSTPSNSMARG